MKLANEIRHRQIAARADAAGVPRDPRDSVALERRPRTGHREFSCDLNAGETERRDSKSGEFKEVLASRWIQRDSCGDRSVA